MALPRESDTYESYTDQLVYFSARLGADPKTAALAAGVDEILEGLDETAAAVRAARRKEVRARAQRDHNDAIGDARTKQFKRRLDVVSDPSFIVERLFPKGVAHMVAPRGRPQLQRIEALLVAIDEVIASPRLAAHAEAEELHAALAAGKQAVTQSIEELREVIEAWEATVLEVSRSRDTFNFHRADGIARLGAIVGELRAVVGGSNNAAYAYTQAARTGSSASADA